MKQLDCQGVPLHGKGKISIMKLPSTEEVNKKIRKSWSINPKTKIVPNKKKKYNRAFTKIELQKILKKEDF
jgi:glucan biosynthesis protein